MNFSAYSNIANATTLVNPASLPNLVLYLNSDLSFSASGSQGDFIATWPDSGGNSPARDALQGTAGLKPTLQKTLNTSPTGKPLVRFDGVDDFLSGSNPNPFPSTALGYTFYFYGRLRQVTAPPGPFAVGVIFTDSATDGAPQIGYEQNPNGKPYVRTAAGTSVVHNANIYGPWQLFVVVFNPPNDGTGTVQAYQALNNGAVTALVGNPTWSINPNLANGGYKISGNVSGNGCIDADVAVVAWYNTAHSLATIQNVRTFWKAEFGEE